MLLKSLGGRFLRIVSYGATDTGRVRKENQDSYVVLKNPGNGSLLGVFDGVGGCDDGKKASKIAVRVLEELYISGELFRQTDIFALKKSMRRISLIIDKKIKEEAKRLGQKLSTTGSILYFYKDMYFISHVGDSRIYLYRDGSLFKLTKDHNLIENGVKTNVLTQVLGTGTDISPYVSFENCFIRDRFLICSDGLTNYLTEKNIMEIFEREPNIENALLTMIDQANQRGGSDNITGIIAAIDDDSVTIIN